jgi:hypothetical protein
VAFSASGVQVVSAKPVANTVVLTLKNANAVPASGTVAISAVAIDGHLMQASAPFSVGAGSSTSVVVVFDSLVSSVGGSQTLGMSDDPNPF